MKRRKPDDQPTYVQDRLEVAVRPVANILAGIGLSAAFVASMIVAEVMICPAA